MHPLAQFAGQSYVSLETYRKNGAAVVTPVWFVERDPGVFYVYSEAGSGKVKRLRNNPRARIAPCTMRGQVIGEWVAATIRIIEDKPADNTEIARAHQLLNRKYPLKHFFNFFSRMMGKPRALLEIRIDKE